MICRSDQVVLEVRENMRGGPGSVTINHFFKSDQIKAKCRLCAKMVVPPGAGIGLHKHDQEDEVYILTKGQGMLNEGGDDIPVRSGDAILTGNGAEHSIRNEGSEDLEIIAVIMQY
jgi:mannose-6-phosphate isomerase-like protein (cupin superfamily)